MPLLTQSLYQLDYLLSNFLPILSSHLLKENIESSTYASQWFMTLFTYSFPRQSVIRIWDIFLLDGVITLFRISLAFLFIHEKHILQLKFEEILKYLKIAQQEINVNILMVNTMKISLQRLTIELEKSEKLYHEKIQEKGF